VVEKSYPQERLDFIDKMKYNKEQEIEKWISQFNK